MPKLLFFILIISDALHSQAQSFDENDFIYYGLKQGLSDNYVSGIVQDSSGYIWIGTHRGLNRFDGKIFKHFSRDDKYNAIPDNSIYSMKLLKDGQLAIATEDGAQIINTRTLEQLNLFIAEDERLRYWSDFCMSAGKDADGNYGVSTKTGFYIFSPSGKIKNRFDFYTHNDIGEWMLFGDDIYQLPDGNIMQLNKNGSLLYDRQTNQISDATERYPSLKELVKEKSNNIFFQVSVSELVHINVETNCFDLIDIRRGKIASFPSCVDFITNIGWMTVPARINDTTWAINCRSKGFFIISINPATKTFSCSPKKYFADKFCSVIFTDKNNQLWIGTNEGLFKQNSHPKIIETFTLAEDPEDINITALYISENKIYAGTENNKILVLDKFSRKLIHSVQLSLSPNVSNYVRCFSLFHPDTLWAGTSSGLFWIHLKNFSTGRIEVDENTESNLIYLLFTDKKNNTWLSTASTYSIYLYDRTARSFQLITNSANPLFKTDVNSVAVDKNGNIWMAGDAIVRWNPKLKKIDSLIERIPSQQNVKKGYSVMADSKGNVWTTVNDDGFVKLTGDNLHLRPKNLIRVRSSFMAPTLLNDKIFIFTNKGLGYFDISNLKSVSFNDADGVPVKPPSTFFFVSDVTDGSVWFACKNIICRIPPRLSVDYLNPPVLNITALSILNDTILNYPGRKINLNYRQADVNIFYSAINYIDPDNMQFAYRVKNKKDSSWIDAGDQQNILLTNISPGNYKLELKVSAFDNKWPDQIKELEINIKPPFWHTSLFYISVALLFTFTVYLIYRYRIRQINQKANLDRQIAQTEMKALHAQMNPHFIFNCLNSIREMILNNENQQASHYLSKFAQLIRITLNQSSKPFITLDHTIDYLERYIEMEKIRNNTFTYTIETDDQLQTEDIMIPPMLIQPFVENAIWHGTVPGKELQIIVRFIKENNRLVCYVDDNGPGIEATVIGKKDINHNSIGIDNVRGRIQVLNEKYKLNSELSIEDKSKTGNETGTVVKLYFPLKSIVS